MPVILFLLITSWKAHNIGIRYILTVYPFLIIYASGFLSRLSLDIAKNTLVTAIVAVLSLWYIFSSAGVYPNYLAYFNEIVGGSRNGYKYLDDSNIEWGHDLKRLAEYQKKNPDLKVVFLWTHIDADRFYGIKNISPLSSKEWLNPNGKYAVSSQVVIRTKLASQVYKNDLLNWRDLYKPVDRIGQSFFIYEF